MILFFDTETTGLPDFRADHAHPKQPHLLQIGATLCQDDGTERASLNVTIRPEGWFVPQFIADLTGISHEVATRSGVKLDVALAIFGGLLQQADLVVAHNKGFDIKIMQVAFVRAGFHDWIMPFAKKKWHCTMEQTKSICQLPATAKQLAAGFGPYKNPKLEEAYRFFFNEELTGAHDALVDVRACQRIFFHLAKGEVNEG